MTVHSYGRLDLRSGGVWGLRCSSPGTAAGDQYIWGQLMAGAVLASIPVGILYFIGQRFVVQGLAAGAVKS